MTDSQNPETEQLIDEIVGYLGAVDVFRAAGYEPAWRQELPSATALSPGTIEATGADVTRERRIPPPRFTV